MIDQWNALRAELALPAYQGTTDQAAADLLNAPVTIATASVPRDSFLLALRPAFTVLQANPTLTGKWSLIFQALFTSESITVDAGTQAMLASAVTDGLLTQPEAAAVAALATAPSSRALQTFGHPVSSADVHAARN